MPNRSSHPISGDESRLGFNGKEIQSEVSNNEYDFGARLFDARIGKWMSRDPKAHKYPYFSPYVAFGDNPIIFTDPQGETLRVAITGNIDNDFIAKRDIEAMLPDGKDQLIKFASDGTVEFTVALEQIKAMAAKDPGVGIIYNMVTATENYLYEVNDVATGKLPNGTEFRKDLAAPIDGNIIEDGKPLAINLQMEAMTMTPKYQGDKARFNGNSSPYPMDDCVDGHLVMDPAFIYLVQSDEDQTPKNRDALVFHELWEIYYRTTCKLAYNDAVSGSTVISKGAHNKAIVKQDLLSPKDRRRDGLSGKATWGKEPNLLRGRNNDKNTTSKPIPKPTSKDQS